MILLHLLKEVFAGLLVLSKENGETDIQSLILSLMFFMPGFSLYFILFRKITTKFSLIFK